MRCAQCQSDLRQVRMPSGFYFLCPKCEGRMVSLAVVRKLAPQDLLREMWYSAAFEQAQPAGRACPSCGKAMATVQQAALPALDICRQCQVMWFDANEFEQVPQAASGTQELSPKAKEAMAMRNVKTLQEQSEREEAREDAEKWADYGNLALTIFRLMP